MTSRPASPPGPTALALATLVFAAACEVPNFKGPQIQSPPPAFTMNREAVEELPMFPDRAIVHHDAWVEASWGNFSGIYINGHLGVLGRDEVDGARRQAIAAAAGKRVEFGELESLHVDERTAWGWGETWRLDNGGLQYVVFRAAIPYDTITYAVDFITGDPGLKIRPDSLRTIVASFAVGKTTWNVPLILIVAGVVLLGVSVLRSRRRARAERHRSIPLVTVPKKEAAKPGAPAASPPAGTAPIGASRAPAAPAQAGPPRGPTPSGSTPGAPPRAPTPGSAPPRPPEPKKPPPRT